MFITDYGNGIQPIDWLVDEQIIPGFSRVYYILSGDVSFKNHTLSKKLLPETLYIFPAYDTFSISHNPNNPINCLWFHIDLLPTMVSKLVEITVKKDSSLYYLLLALKQEFLETSGKNGYYLTLIDGLIKYFYLHGYLIKPNEELSSIISYIKENYRTPISVAEISRHFNYTTEHFIRMFQKQVSITPYQYITNCRMNEATRLIMEDVPIIEIAHLTGYSDAKTFSHAFKQKFQVPPTKFKFYYTGMA